MTFESPPIPPRRKFLLASIGVALLLAVAEALAWCALAWLDHRDRAGAKEEFNVRAFTERTGDARGVTLKQNVTIEVADGPARWTVVTGAARTRIPPDFTARAVTGSTRPLFLFLGDSVPFGWGVAAEDSLPGRFAALADSVQVINAAIPSYSLAQTVLRYEQEFAQLPGQKFVYLQVYDPVSQYVVFGQDWQETDNWTNYPARLAEVHSLFGRAKWLKTSHLLELIDRAYFQFSSRGSRARSAASDDRFASHVIRELDQFAALTSRSGARVIVAPATISMRRRLASEDPHGAVLELFNSTLKQQAAKHGWLYLDTLSLLDAPDNSDFVDRCCHLSRQGAEKVAHQLAALLSKEG